MTAGDAVGEPHDGATLADRMRQHAGDSDHLYGHLTRSMADDWEAGGPVRRSRAARTTSTTIGSTDSATMPRMIGSRLSRTKA